MSPQVYKMLVASALVWEVYDEPTRLKIGDLPWAHSVKMPQGEEGSWVLQRKDRSGLQYEVGLFCPIENWSHMAASCVGLSRSNLQSTSHSPTSPGFPASHHGTGLQQLLVFTNDLL